MGSLLREYLDDSRESDDSQERDDPQEPDDILHTSDTDEKQIDTSENGTASVINEMNPEISLNEVKMDTDHACDSNEGEPDTKNNCLTNDGFSSNARRHFKNVVAIVDPPRGGLHPTVSVHLLSRFSAGYVKFRNSKKQIIITRHFFNLYNNLNSYLRTPMLLDSSSDRLPVSFLVSRL